MYSKVHILFIEDLTVPLWIKHRKHLHTATNSTETHRNIHLFVTKRP